MLLSKEAKLKYLALVNVRDIPLFLAAGPVLDVWSNDERTEEALRKWLLFKDDNEAEVDGSGQPWWEVPSGQSEQGILVRVEGSISQGGASLNTQATELLLYGTVTAVPRVDGLLTPPRSSSPVQDDPTFGASQPSIDTRVRLYALPLRRAKMIPVQKDLLPDIGEAQFLQPKTSCTDLIQDFPATKRRKISNVFDDATQQRRKLKGRGGEAVSRAMATEAIATASLETRPQPVRAEQPKDNNISDSGKGKVTSAPNSRRSLSRVSSTDTLQSQEPSRPPSRRDSFIPGKRSGLNRVESILSGPASPSIPDCDNDLQQQNTSTLSRIVMAGMRMYGLQQRKKMPKQIAQMIERSDTPDSLPNTANGDYDEYKMVYHQTFKGACFAFRNHLAFQTVSQDAMREVVDRLLLIYCTDPLPKSGLDSLGHQSFGSQEDKSFNAFDLPSTEASTAVAATPSARRSKHPNRDDGLDHHR